MKNYAKFLICAIIASAAIVAILCYHGTDQSKAACAYPYGTSGETASIDQSGNAASPYTGHGFGMTCTDGTWEVYYRS